MLIKTRRIIAISVVILIIVGIILFWWLLYGAYYWDQHVIQPRLVAKYLRIVQRYVHQGDAMSTATNGLDRCGFKWVLDSTLPGPLPAYAAEPNGKPPYAIVYCYDIDGANVSYEQYENWCAKHDDYREHRIPSLNGRDEIVIFIIYFANGRVSHIRGHVYRELSGS